MNKYGSCRKLRNPKNVWHCPKIDTLIKPAIYFFNKRGFETIYCCAGHINREEGDLHSCYIMFRDKTVIRFWLIQKPILIYFSIFFANLMMLLISLTLRPR